MFKLKMYRILMLTTVLLFLIHAPLERFGLGVKSMQAFPLYHWELGFGSVKKNAKSHEILITTLNNQELPTPIKATDWLLEKGIFRPTAHYKLAHRLAKSLQPSAKDSRDQTLSTLNSYLFKGTDVHQATYLLLENHYEVLDSYFSRTNGNLKRLETFDYVH